MANYLISDSTMTGIANAIRSKTGQPGSLLGSAFASAIQSIPTGYTTKINGDDVQSDLDLISNPTESYVDLPGIGSGVPSVVYVGSLFNPIYRILAMSDSSGNTYCVEKTVSFNTTHYGSSHPVFFKTVCVVTDANDAALYYAVTNKNVVMFLDANDDPMIVYPEYNAKGTLYVRDLRTLELVDTLTITNSYLGGFIKGVYPIKDENSITRSIYIVNAGYSGSYTELGRYDLINKTYTYLARLTSLRIQLGRIPGVVYHDVVSNVDHDDLYVIGKYANSSGTSNLQIYKYDSVANTWSQVCDIPYASSGADSCRDFYIPACVNRPSGDLDQGVHPVVRILTTANEYDIQLDSQSLITSVTPVSISSSYLSGYIGSEIHDSFDYDYFINMMNIVRSTDTPYSAPKSLITQNIANVPMYTLDEP